MVDDIRTQFLPLMCENTRIREDKHSECTDVTLKNMALMAIIYEMYRIN